MPKDHQLSFDRAELPDPEEQRLNVVALSHVRGLGEVSLKALLAAYENLGLVWHQPAEALSKVLVGAGLHTPRSVVEQIRTSHDDLFDTARRELDRLARQGIHVITELDDAYPTRLRDLQGRPRWLFVQGDPKVRSMTALIADLGKPEEISKVFAGFQKYLYQKGA